jgi:hypothetical protein
MRVAGFGAELFVTFDRKGARLVEAQGEAIRLLF